MNLPNGNGGGCNRFYRPRSPRWAVPTTTIGGSSTGFAGGCGPEHPGAICPRDTGSGRRCTAASEVGTTRASGSASWRRSRPRKMRTATSIGTATSWMGAWCEPTRTRQGRKGGRPSAWAQSWWFLHETPRPCRGTGQAGRLRVERRRAPRAEALADLAGDWSDPPIRAGTSAFAPPAHRPGTRATAARRCVGTWPSGVSGRSSRGARTNPSNATSTAPPTGSAIA